MNWNYTQKIIRIFTRKLKITMFNGLFTSFIHHFYSHTKQFILLYFIPSISYSLLLIQAYYNTYAITEKYYKWNIILSCIPLIQIIVSLLKKE